ncbi:peptidase E [Nocardia sp. NBC_00565]|uniref:Type 1 glutamine amidotransferase-like domain-containing protein n=1 Tax=Nocardia sp. NBC_00565 TaxID=2975993 RepID=UPI002E80E710|nr:Type 1 glutamine amidotransferase-like domain-containing protein [Nocardia sp. NBC_00565]WUC03085.1 peptidase E [Nocardia sp. NBC_00565]
MRLFLSSYRFGAHYDRLAALVGAPGRVAVIPNACDAWPAAWSGAVSSDVVPLRKLGYAPEVLDLREFVGRATALARTLADYPLVWVRGGNTFVLRAQFARSGADIVLPELLAADALVYAGYSAGACLLTPDLRGLESTDDPAEVEPTCGIEPRWDGLGLVDHRIVPHLDSATDPDGASTLLAARYRNEGIPHWALTDDDVVVVDGDRTEVLR